MKTSEEKLREEAEARVGFKSHFKTYILVILLIWAFWFFTRGQQGNYDGFWPVYPTLGWGFGIFMHYMGVYKNNNSAVEKEIEKLKRERGIS